MYLQTAARLAGMNRLSGLSSSMRWRIPVSVATIIVSLSELARVAHHALGREEVGPVRGDVAGGDVLHHLGRAAALGVDQEVGLGLGSRAAR